MPDMPKCTRCDTESYLIQVRTTLNPITEDHHVEGMFECPECGARTIITAAWPQPEPEHIHTSEVPDIHQVPVITHRSGHNEPDQESPTP